MSRHRGPHQTSDGYVAIMPYTDENWKALFEAVDRMDMMERPWFAEHGARLKDADRVFQDLADDRHRAHHRRVVRAVRSPRHSRGAGAHDRRDRRRSRRSTVASCVTSRTRSSAEYRHIESPMKFSSTPTSLRRPAPLVGEQTDEILAELGFSGAELDALRERGRDASLRSDDARR